MRQGRGDVRDILLKGLDMTERFVPPRSSGTPTASSEVASPRLELSRRQFFRISVGTTVVVVVGSASSGCAGAAAVPIVAAPALQGAGGLGAAILTVLATGIIEGFGEQLAEEIVDEAPAFARATMDALHDVFGDVVPSTWGRYNGDSPTPSLTLRSLAAGAQFGSEDGNLRAVVIHDVDGGRRLELPMIVQVGLNFLMRIQAGDTGQLLGPPEGISDREFERRLRRIRPEYAVVEYQPYEGPDGYLNKPGRYEVSNSRGQTMRFTWTPAITDRARMSTLLVQKGRVTGAGKPRWDIDQLIYLSYSTLFGAEENTVAT
jgi:hypothetical protein